MVTYPESYTTKYYTKNIASLRGCRCKGSTERTQPHPALLGAVSLSGLHPVSSCHSTHSLTRCLPQSFLRWSGVVPLGVPPLLVLESGYLALSLCILSRQSGETRIFSAPKLAALCSMST